MHRVTCSVQLLGLPSGKVAVLRIEKVRVHALLQSNLLLSCTLISTILTNFWLCGPNTPSHRCHRYLLISGDKTHYVFFLFF